MLHSNNFYWRRTIIEMKANLRHPCGDESVSFSLVLCFVVVELLLSRCDRISCCFQGNKKKEKIIQLRSTTWDAN